MLVYRPTAPPVMMTASGGIARNQIGWFSADGSVATTSHPGANAVNQLVEVVILNYLAVHGQQGQMSTLFPTNGLDPRSTTGRPSHPWSELLASVNGVIATQPGRVIL